MNEPKKQKEIYLFRHGFSKANSLRNQKILFPKLLKFIRGIFGFTVTLKIMEVIDFLRGLRTRSNTSDALTPLELLGVKQSELTGNILAEKNIIPDLILCSDYLRTRQTANGIIKGIKEKINIDLENKILYSNLIIERSSGVEYGYPLSYYPILFPETNVIYKKMSKFDFRPPEGESIRDVREKRIPHLLTILNSLNFNTLFIVGHGITNSTIVSLLCEKDIESVNIGTKNLGVYKFVMENGGKWKLDPNFENGKTIHPSIPFSF